MWASASDTPPNTIVLIHGFWVTPRSWGHWKLQVHVGTEVVEFDGPHLLPAIPEWEAVADFALD